MSEDKSFHIHATATGKARCPTVESRTAGPLSLALQQKYDKYRLRHLIR